MEGRLARRSGRCEFQAPIQIDGPDGTTIALTENIGPGGLFVATSNPSRVGDRLSLIFRMWHGDTPIVVDGEVRWVRTSPLPGARGGARGMGIRFTNLSLSASATIQEFLRRSNGT
jgi:uncharacterized protein (TIGR02266 family)